MALVGRTTTASPYHMRCESTIFFSWFFAPYSSGGNLPLDSAAVPFEEDHLGRSTNFYTLPIQYHHGRRLSLFLLARTRAGYPAVYCFNTLSCVFQASVAVIFLLFPYISRIGRFRAILRDLFPTVDPREVCKSRIIQDGRSLTALALGGYLAIMAPPLFF